jgi:hypothetical protein
MSADPSCVTVQVDWQNAFHTLCRDHMLVAVEQRCPALLPIAAWAYGRHSHLLVHQAPRTVVRSQCGVRQGNPLGLLLFDLTLQGLTLQGLTLQGPLEGGWASSGRWPTLMTRSFKEPRVLPCVHSLPSQPSQLFSACTSTPPSVLSTPGTTLPLPPPPF